MSPLFAFAPAGADVGAGDAAAGAAVVVLVVAFVEDFGTRTPIAGLAAGAVVAFAIGDAAFAAAGEADAGAAPNEDAAGGDDADAAGEGELAAPADPAACEANGAGVAAAAVPDAAGAGVFCVATVVPPEELLVAVPALWDVVAPCVVFEVVVLDDAVVCATGEAPAADGAAV